MNNISENIKRINCILSETAGLYHKLNVALDLSDSVSDILYLLYDNEGCYPIRAICADLGMPKQTVNSALRNLEKDDILFLETYSGRNKRAVLTEKGQKFCAETVAYIFQIENSVFSKFSDSEMEMFLVLHEKYNRLLEKHIDDYKRLKNE